MLPSLSHSRNGTVDVLARTSLAGTSFTSLTLRSDKLRRSVADYVGEKLLHEEELGGGGEGNGIFSDRRKKSRKARV